MHRIDELFPAYPFYGGSKMNVHLCREGRLVNVKRGRRLMRKMGLAAVYPKPKLSGKRLGHTIYPYLLRAMKSVRANQDWCTDIPYIRLCSEKNGMTISMDGRGHAFDNIFQERLWRSVKYEKVYLNDWEQVEDVDLALHDYFTFYNHIRPHQSLLYYTPYEVYCNGTLITES